MIHGVNSSLFRSFLGQKGGRGAYDKRKVEEQRFKANVNKPAMTE